jgi:hypothetical protein
MKLNFGQAVEAMKDGKAVRRSGWNGKGMFLGLHKGNKYVSENEEVPDYIEGIRTYLFERGHKDTITRLPTVVITTPTGSTSVWTASQHDLLAEDWEILTLNGLEV